MDEQKKVAEEFDKYHDSYTNTVNDSLSFTGLDVDFFTVVKADYIVGLINAHFGNNAEVSALDVGCGVGNFHRILTPRVNQLTGIDVSHDSIAKAKELNEDVQYDIYDGKKLPYADNSFDVAFTICVMHHVPPSQWRNFVEEMHRVVKLGGLALIFEHNPQNFLTRRVVNNCPFDADAVLLEGSKTKGLMELSGFGITDLNYILTIPAKGTLLRRVDQWFSKIPLGAQYYVSAVKSI